MQYLGGKHRIAKRLVAFMLPRHPDITTFVDVFCGALNVVRHVPDSYKRIANDKVFSLIELWKAVQNGWIPPSNISKEEYNNAMLGLYSPELTAFILFGCSFGGKYGGGYARNSIGSKFTRAEESSRGCIKKGRDIHNVTFTNYDYRELPLPEKAIIYCDPPYLNATPYKASGPFDHMAFYEWCRNIANNGYPIYISGYLQHVPDDFYIVWGKETTRCWRNSHGTCDKVIEVLMTPSSGI